MKTQTSKTYYIATAKATQTRALFNEPIGAEIDVAITLDENYRPSWLEFSPTKFPSADEARKSCSAAGKDSWGFNDVRDIKIKQVTETLITETHDVDD